MPQRPHRTRAARGRVLKRTRNRTSPRVTAKQPRAPRVHWRRPCRCRTHRHVHAVHRVCTATNQRSPCAHTCFSRYQGIKVVHSRTGAAPGAGHSRLRAPGWARWGHRAHELYNYKAAETSFRAPTSQSPVCSRNQVIRFVLKLPSFFLGK